MPTTRQMPWSILSPNRPFPIEIQFDKMSPVQTFPSIMHVLYAYMSGPKNIPFHETVISNSNLANIDARVDKYFSDIREKALADAIFAVLVPYVTYIDLNARTDFVKQQLTNQFIQQQFLSDSGGNLLAPTLNHLEQKAMNEPTYREPRQLLEDIMYNYTRKLGLNISDQEWLRIGGSDDIKPEVEKYYFNNMETTLERVLARAWYYIYTNDQISRDLMNAINDQYINLLIIPFSSRNRILGDLFSNVLNKTFKEFIDTIKQEPRKTIGRADLFNPDKDPELSGYLLDIRVQDMIQTLQVVKSLREDETKDQDSPIPDVNNVLDMYYPMCIDQSIIVPEYPPWFSELAPIPNKSWRKQYVLYPMWVVVYNVVLLIHSLPNGKQDPLGAMKNLQETLTFDQKNVESSVFNIMVLIRGRSNKLPKGYENAIQTLLELPFNIPKNSSWEQISDRIWDKRSELSQFSIGKVSMYMDLNYPGRKIRRDETKIETNF